MQPDYFDNRARIVKDDLVAQIGVGDRVSVAAPVFSMYAYRELTNFEELFKTYSPDTIRRVI